MKAKKGVKRKAEPITPASVYDYNIVDAPKPPKMIARRESGRQIKKIIRPDIDGSYRSSLSPVGPSAYSSLKSKEKLSEPLKDCNDILKELFAKKHSVSAFFQFCPTLDYRDLMILITRIFY